MSTRRWAVGMTVVVLAVLGSSLPGCSSGPHDIGGTGGDSSNGGGAGGFGNGGGDSAGGGTAGGSVGGGGTGGTDEAGGGGGRGGGNAGGNASGGGGMPFDPGFEPTSRIRPIAGEVTLIQLDLPIGILLAMGESTLVVGPDGTTILIDVGNNSHSDDVLEVVERVNTQDLIPSRGFPAREARDIDWVILTHYHTDHIGAVAKLLTGSKALRIRQGLVTRGMVDLGAGVTESDTEALCNALNGPLASVSRTLCSAASAAPCSRSGWASQFPATSCAGFLKGDLATTADDGLRETTYLKLGGGGKLTLYGGNAHVVENGKVVNAPAFGDSTSHQENARSLVGWLEFGAFRYHFGGDLTGSGVADAPDIETFVAQHNAARIGALGADVTKANHHARRGSSTPNFVERFAPKDGNTRNVVAGINAAYGDSPHKEALDAWLANGRLGGGRFWVPRVSPLGARDPLLIEAQGDVTVQTIAAGQGYRIQASRTNPFSMAFRSLRK